MWGKENKTKTNGEKMNASIYETLKANCENHGATFALWNPEDHTDTSFFNDPNIYQKITDKFVICSLCPACSIEQLDHTPHAMFHRGGGGSNSGPRLQSAIVGTPMEGSYITHLFKPSLLGSTPLNEVLGGDDGDEKMKKLDVWMRLPANDGYLKANLAYFKSECDSIGNPNLVVLALGKKTYDFLNESHFPYRVIRLPSHCDTIAYKDGTYRNQVASAIIEGLY